MDHQHIWQKEPPDEGKLLRSRTADERQGDEEDMAYNSGWACPEELQHLRLLVEEDPNFENSSDWPEVVEWCSSCTITRVVKLVLPNEIKVLESPVEVEEGTADSKVDEEKACCDAFTQTPPRQRPRRRGGRASRIRRMLSYQLMLTVKRGLPLSKLLSNQKTDARSSKAELQKKFVTPSFKVKEEVVIKKEEKLEEVAEVKVKEEKEEVVCPSEGVSTSGSSNFTLRNSQSVANPSSSHPLPIGPVMHPFSVPPPPLFTPHFIPCFQTPQYCQTPAANWGFCGGCQCWGPVIPICFLR